MFIESIANKFFFDFIFALIEFTAADRTRFLLSMQQSIVDFAASSADSPMEKPFYSFIFREIQQDHFKFPASFLHPFDESIHLADLSRKSINET